MNRPLLVVLGAVVFALMSVIFFWGFKLTMANSMKSDMVSPEKVAEFIHAILEANRNNYTDNVVVKLQKEGVQAHEHWKDERGVALPAQYLMESGRLVSTKDLKLSFRLASLTPIYVWNGPNSDLERQGLAAVDKNPDEPHFGYLTKGGVRYFQAIYADRASSQACVECHNQHTNSPRRDFKMDDVMGGIVITFPVGE